VAGADFDGVIVFDEAHAMANAAGGGKGARGPKKASQQGMAGLALQNRLPGARILYVSATGRPRRRTSPTPPGSASGAGPKRPSRPASLHGRRRDRRRGGDGADRPRAEGLGLYIARSLSFDGVEYEALRHPLTPGDVEIWDAWADAYQLIHHNLRAALEAVGITEDGKAKSGQAASAVLSAFEGAKLRFFGHLLAGLKAPTLIASIRGDLAEGDRPWSRSSRPTRR
jgi:hypothetical protein